MVPPNIQNNPQSRVICDFARVLLLIFNRNSLVLYRSARGGTGIESENIHIRILPIIIMHFN